MCDPGESEVEEARPVMRSAAEAPDPEHTSSHEAARQVLVGLWERDVIRDEGLARMVRETDLHARAAQKNALPDAEPAQPL